MALKAQYTAYHDTVRSADGSYPNENTCAAPPEIPFGTKIKVSGTGTYVDGRVYTVTDRGRLVKKTGDRYIFDLWMPSESKCYAFGRRNGWAAVIGGSSKAKKGKNSKKTRNSGCDIVGVAAKEIGYRETGDNHTKYGVWYGMDGAAWCHMFVSWCASKAGIPQSVIPKTASTDEGMAWFKGRGHFKYKGKYTPKRGDLVYFKTGRSHVGIVEKVTGSTLHTIEGNSSDKVARRTYPLSEKTITGYGVPEYTGTNANGTGTGSTGGSKKQSSGGELKYLKKVLERHSGTATGRSIDAEVKETSKLPEGKAVVKISNGSIKFTLPVLDGMKLSWERMGTPGKLTFEAPYEKKFKAVEGSTVLLKVDGINLFKGYIFSRKMSEDGIMSYTAYDQLRYLKNKDCIVYKEKTATELVKIIAEKFRLEYGELADTGYRMSAAEDGATLFDIIQDALDNTLIMTGKVYVLYDSLGRLCLSDVSCMKVNSCVVDAETGEGFTYGTTIDDGVYNQVKLVYENGKKRRYETYMSRHIRNIGRWGVLQYLEKIDTPDLGELKSKALLALYSKKRKSLSVSGVTGSCKVRAGSLVPVILGLKDMKVSNYMMVEKVTHIFKNRQHTMDMVLSGGGFDA